MIDDKINQLLRLGDRANDGPEPDPDSQYGRDMLARIHREAGIDTFGIDEAAIDTATTTTSDNDVATNVTEIDFEAEPERRRGRRSLLLVAVAAALFATGAGFYLARTTPSATVTMACHSEASPSADIVVIGNPPVLAADACRPAWTSGILQNDAVAAGEIPPLIGCTMASGVLGVYPGNEETCASLGLPIAAPVAPADGPSVVDVIDSVFDTNPCVPLEDAAVLLQQGFAAAGIELKVERPVSAPADRPCASVAVDEAAGIVLIVPIPNPAEG